MNIQGRVAAYHYYTVESMGGFIGLCLEIPEVCYPHVDRDCALAGIRLTTLKLLLQAKESGCLNDLPKPQDVIMVDYGGIA